MTSQNKHEDTPTASQPRQTSAVVFMLSTIADTTWRMFVPIIGLTVLGLWADKQLHTTPWLMILGIIVGTALAALLIRRQMLGIQEKEK